MLRENIEMRGLIDKLGFEVGPADEAGVQLAVLRMNDR
jgi:hypothetical protein